MKLKKLFENIEGFELDGELEEVEINGIKIDPKKVKKGDLFLSIKNGEEEKKNILTAIENGASVCVSQNQTPNAINVEDVRSAYALLSKAYYENACDKLKIIGITGTNGKTTTTHIIGEILKRCGKQVATIGTLGVSIGNKKFDTGFTTPDPEILHKAFYNMKKAGVEYVVMEVSAHALALKKLDGINFELSVFTNLTQDHLDFFENMENYFDAKRKLFSFDMSKAGIVCADDEYGKKLLEDMQIPILTYGFNSDNDCYAKGIKDSTAGSKFLCSALNDWMDIDNNFVGNYNIQNILASILTCRILGISNEQIEKSIKEIYPPEGRFNLLKCGGKSIVVDFAHTPDGLEKILKSARNITSERVICVFGCGGNRDRAKRPIMGKIAEELSDEVIVTSDNPRFENPMDIIKEIEKGMKKQNHKAIEKREDAVFEAIKSARRGDVVVIAGKGGEKYQDIQGIKYPYNDFDVIKKSVKKLLEEGRDRKNVD